MTFWELYFGEMSVFLFPVIVMLLLLLIPTLLILFSKAKIETDMRVFMCISWGLILACLTVMGIVRFYEIEKKFDSQLTVNLADESTRKSLQNAGVSCLLLPHENNSRLRVTYIDMSIWPRMLSLQDSPYVIFKNQTLLFFYLDQNTPKQSILDIEETCILDLNKTLKQKEKEKRFKKEQDFLKSVSKGGEK